MIENKALAEKVAEFLDKFFAKRIQKLNEMNLARLIKKNPYLYRAIGVVSATDFVDQLMAALVSSSDETIFGNEFFEPLAKWAATEHFSEVKGTTVQTGGGAGFDISIEASKYFLAIAAKSGTNIYNAQSGKAQKGEFGELQRRLKKENKAFMTLIGHGYGRTAASTNQSQEKLAGQAFWARITGEDNFYIRIAAAMGDKPVAHRKQHDQAYALAQNRIVKEFSEKFVKKDGHVNWDALIEINSSIRPPKKPKAAVAKAAVAKKK